MTKAQVVEVLSRGGYISMKNLKLRGKWTYRFVLMDIDTREGQIIRASTFNSLRRQGIIVTDTFGSHYLKSTHPNIPKLREEMEYD